MKIIRVTAGVINNGGKCLIAKRKSTGSLPNYWEFPGGKIEDGETPEESLQRELFEELGIIVQVENCISDSIYQYENFAIHLLGFKVKYLSGEYSLREHSQMKWVSLNDLKRYPFAPADEDITKNLSKI